MAVRNVAALTNRNFRLYMVGQLVSQAGTWMQVVGQAWLVLRLTDSGVALGIVTALQALPVMFLAPFGGLVADRTDKRKMLACTQAGAGLLAFVLWVLTATDSVELWMVYLLAAGLGFVNVFDNPARQTFALELVGPEHLANAVSLNNVNFNASRIVGPAIAAAVIKSFGLPICFLANSISFAAVIGALALLRKDELHPSRIQERGKRQVREGFRYVRRTPELFVPICVMFVTGCFAYETQVTLPLLAKKTFHGDAGTYSSMSIAMGIGAVLGGLLVVSRITPTRRNFVNATFGLGIVMLVCAAAPTLWTALALLVVLGGASVGFLAMANATLQLSAPPDMRGRVMSLWSVAFLGSTPIGGPIVGYIGEHYGARLSLAVGGIGPLLAAAIALPALRDLKGGLRAVAGSHL